MKYGVDHGGKTWAVEGATYYHLKGPATGKLVVIMPGITSFAASVAPLAECLIQRNHRVLLFDLFGRGRSPYPPSQPPCSHVLFADQLYHLLDKLGLADVSGGITLLGLSLGGAIALTLAQRYPKLVRRLLLVAPAGLPGVTSPLLSVLKVPWLGEAIINTLGRLLLSAVVGDFDDTEHPGCLLMRSVTAWQADNTPGYINGLLSTLRHFPLASMEEVFREVGQYPRPVLLLWGEEDQTCPFDPCCFIASECLPNATLRVIPNGGHCMALEQAGRM
ncbi:unnamed protein product [Vitrella brassicaformis CCMP3155]|uniref:Serine aminopeptidase S33 domain-containing protein n=1 Tax=Vitrella brassicaformis (strain CCMP3155) TaxID=1169540 RepID=A0A0G4GMA1_VITBC|nr:unnamed protein product [Vitrella brassicaformis CCMP3155]|eukprot:CEM31323.1 unnamed protein product [Vitrella brassicaformis CCMP3155]